ncbi:MAG: prolipoprotein diacylglyceryl transferase [Bacteroidota bacterium]
MYPELFKIGPFTVYSFGLMMGISFIVANYFLAKELKRKGVNPAFASSITLIALVAGISGSKILYLLENFGDFVQDPIGRAFSPAGLTWYGGFILATAMIYLYGRSKKVSFWKIADSASPGLIWAYGIARIGCHLSGDGDYGIPTTLPWGVSYARGTYPPSEAFRTLPEIARAYPNGIVPDNTPLHPTPIYEFILATGIFLLLWELRKRDYPAGRLFMIYLIAAGLERFFIEFIRINPRILFGLSEAQIIAIVLIAAGLYGLSRFKAREATA